MDVDKIPDKRFREVVSVFRTPQLGTPKLASMTYQPYLPGPKFSSVPAGSFGTIHTYLVCGHSIV